MANYAAGSETEVDLITKVDYNIDNGIGRASKDGFANCLILGWPQAASFVEKIVGEKTESILNQTDATLMMCRLERPFISNNLIQVSVPPLAEWEVGFAYWMEKITKLAQELTLPINFVCNLGTRRAIELMIETLNSSVPFDFELYNDWDSIAGLKTLNKADSIQIFVSARNG